MVQIKSKSLIILFSFILLTSCSSGEDSPAGNQNTLELIKIPAQYGTVAYEGTGSMNHVFWINHTTNETGPPEMIDSQCTDSCTRYFEDGVNSFALDNYLTCIDACNPNWKVVIPLTDGANDIEVIREVFGFGVYLYSEIYTETVIFGNNGISKELMPSNWI